MRTISALISANRYGFKASGSRLLFDGYTAVYTEGRDDDTEEKEGMLPEMAAGDVFKLKKLDKEQKFTQPPPRYTEASLVRALEEKGIGRPSTYAPTITTIVERGYVHREKKLLYPTELGEIVTNLMREYFERIVDVEFTAEMEERLDEVEEGKNSSVKILDEFYAPFAKSVEAASANIEKVVIADEVSDIPCDKCGAMMVYKHGRFGKFLACPNYPNCKNTKPIVETIATPCPKCGAKLIKRKAKKGGRVFLRLRALPRLRFCVVGSARRAEMSEVRLGDGVQDRQKRQGNPLHKQGMQPFHPAGQRGDRALTQPV